MSVCRAVVKLSVSRDKGDPLRMKCSRYSVR